MSGDATRRVIVLALIVALAGSATVTPTVGAQTTAAGNVGLTVETADSSIGERETTTATVAVTGATGGVGTYDLTVAVTGPGDARITGVEPLTAGGDGPITRVDYASDKQAVHVEAATLDGAHAPEASIELLTVTLTGSDAGSATIQVSDRSEITDTDGDQYGIESHDGGALAIEESVAVAVDAPSADDAIETGAVRAFPVVVKGAEDGISAYNVTLGVDDSETAQIVGFESGATDDDGPLIETKRAETGARLTVRAVQLDAVHSADDEVEVGTLRVEGVAPGETAVRIEAVGSITGRSLTDYHALSTGSPATAMVSSDGGAGIPFVSRPSNEETATPTPTETATPTVTTTATATPTATATDTPMVTTTTTATPPATATDTPTVTTTVTDTPTVRARTMDTDTPTEAATTTATATSTSRGTPLPTDSANDPTTTTSETLGTMAGTDSGDDDSSGTPNETNTVNSTVGTTSGDGAGFTTGVALLAILAGTLLARRR